MYYDMNRQAQIDKAMCKPGYTWNETLQKCLGYGGGTGNEVPTMPAPPEEPGETPTGAIKQEKGKRAKAKANGNGAPAAPPMKPLK